MHLSLFSIFSIATPLLLTLCAACVQPAAARPNAKPSQTESITTHRNTMTALRQLLQLRLEHPEQAAAIDAQIQTTFGVTRAVMVLDSSGFSQLTQRSGIIAALAAIHQMQTIVVPVVTSHNGSIVKLEADNVYAVFPDVASATRAAQAIMQQLNSIDRPVSIGIGYGNLLMIGSETDEYEVGDRDLYGNEMNLASKLGEDIAQKAEILLTEAAYRQLSDRPIARLENQQVGKWESVETQISGVAIELYRWIGN
jgi:adenylate cyclase